MEQDPKRQKASAMHVKEKYEARGHLKPFKKPDYYIIALNELTNLYFKEPSRDQKREMSHILFGRFRRYHPYQAYQGELEVDPFWVAAGYDPFDLWCSMYANNELAVKPDGKVDQQENERVFLLGIPTQWYDNLGLEIPPENRRVPQRTK